MIKNLTHISHFDLRLYGIEDLDALFGEVALEVARVERRQGEGLQVEELGGRRVPERDAFTKLNRLIDQL